MVSRQRGRGAGGRGQAGRAAACREGVGGSYPARTDTLVPAWVPLPRWYRGPYQRAAAVLWPRPLPRPRRGGGGAPGRVGGRGRPPPPGWPPRRGGPKDEGGAGRADDRGERGGGRAPTGEGGGVGGKLCAVDPGQP